MSIWILTTGNSDIILKHDENWGELHNQASNDLECSDFGTATKIDPQNKDAGYTVPARVLGIVYQNQSEQDYENDLKFPLLDTYCQYLTDKNIKIDQIIILLTDQSQIFSNEEQRLHEKSPYWQDTCTLAPLFAWYFKKSNFTCQVEFTYLTPHANYPGIDNWDATLSLIEAKLKDLELDVNQEVYVSHQAGTPAISSAVQFVTLGKFKKVQFLVSNEYFDEVDYKFKSKSDTIASSRYQRGMQIQKAKQLLNKGLPAAAKEILIDIVDDKTMEKIDQVVDLFNIKSSFTKGQEFEIKSAVSRIVTALDLIEIFFQQENYIQGIAILNATQETFLKAAILAQKKKINDSIINLSDIVDWNERGLFLKSQNHLHKFKKSQDIFVFLKSLNFPIPLYNDFDYSYWDKYLQENYKSFKLNNSRQFQWLCALKKDLFSPWEILSWSCQYEREREDDLRNQLLHNLLGVDKIEVRDYLLGYNDNLIKIFSASIKQLHNNSKQINEVDEAYRQNVKIPFLKSLKLFGLSQETTPENKLQIKLQQIADSIN